MKKIIQMTEEQSPDDLGSVWLKYGLQESPFTTTPTRLSGKLPISKVFSGRKEETKKLIRIITSSNTTRTLITGKFGVGKTTFANYVKWRLCLKNKENHFITTPVGITVQSNWHSNPIQFLLSTLGAIYNASIVFEWKKKGINLKTLEKIEPYVTTSNQRAIQANLAGIGGGYSETKITPPLLNPNLLESLLIKIGEELVQQQKRLILSYDNLENMDLVNRADFFRNIKEYIQVEGIHTLFIGPPNSISCLEKNPQVHSIFGPHINLNSLTQENVFEILKKRCEVLKVEQGNYIQPYDEETVKNLYSNLNNIRFTFKVLEDVTLSSENIAPCAITMKEIHAVQEKEKKQIFSNLTTQETKIITTLMENNKLNLGKLSEITRIGITNLRTPLTKLENKGLVTITPSEKDKRKKFAKLSDNSYLKVCFTMKKNNTNN